MLTAADMPTILALFLFSSSNPGLHSLIRTCVPPFGAMILRKSLTDQLTNRAFETKECKISRQRSHGIPSDFGRVYLQRKNPLQRPLICRGANRQPPILP
jgi:hypothetical protein